MKQVLMPWKNNKYYFECFLLLLAAIVMSNASNVKEIKSVKFVDEKNIESTDRNNQNSFENDKDLTDSSKTVPLKHTKLKFHEMVRIYHDIWNTILMGQSRDLDPPYESETIFQGEMREKAQPKTTAKPDLHQLFRIITPLDIVRDTLETVSSITKRRGTAQERSSVLSSRYHKSPIRYLKGNTAKVTKRQPSINLEKSRRRKKNFRMKNPKTNSKVIINKSVGLKGKRFLSKVLNRKHLQKMKSDLKTNVKLNKIKIPVPKSYSNPLPQPFKPSLSYNAVKEKREQKTRKPNQRLLNKESNEKATTKRPLDFPSAPPTPTDIDSLLTKQPNIFTLTITPKETDSSININKPDQTEYVANETFVYNDEAQVDTTNTPATNVTKTPEVAEDKQLLVPRPGVLAPVPGPQVIQLSMDATPLLLPIVPTVFGKDF